jgi:MHS family alpha-ketoglutarate permease-like MFS transporter
LLIQEFLLARIGDRLGRKKALMTSVVLIACARLIVSGYTAINALVKAELFPAAIRATGAGVPYAFAVSVSGVAAEYLALWFRSVTMESGSCWYATAVISCMLAVCWFMRETSTTLRIDAEEAKAGRK